MKRTTTSAPEPGKLREADSPLAGLRAALESRSSIGVRRELLALTNVNTPDPVAGERALHILAEHDHVDGMQFILRRGAKPELTDIYHRTPLHSAARAGKIGPLKLLLDTKCDPDTVASDGSRPIFDTIFYQHREAAKLLIDRAPQVVKSRNANLETPLHTLASTNGDPEIAKALVQAGAQLDAQDIDNDTPLHLAVEYGYEPLVRFLLRAGAHTSLVNRLGLTPDLMPPAFVGRDTSRSAMLVAHTRWIRQLQRYASNPAHLVLLGG